MNYLNSYLRSKIDLSSIGFQRGEKESDYFCTPVLSKVIGWAGVDGIHFCTTKDFGEIIFAVSPANLPGEYVHPVARNFEDFLRLILACGDTAAIEQCWFMDREVFKNFLASNPPTEQMLEALRLLEKKYKLTPMEDPFGYIHRLQDSFDYDSLRFRPEYYELVDPPAEPEPPEWKVTWDGEFFDNASDSVCAEPVSVGTEFQWAGIDWYVPEVYSFDKGVILYLLGKVDPGLVPMDDYSEFISPEAHEQMMAENPLNLHIRPELKVNDLHLRLAGSSGITWVPNQGWNTESKWVLEHYGLDLNYAWQIHRIRFFWPVCGPMDLDKMSMTMIQIPISVSGTHFKTPNQGKRVILTHPKTDKQYTLIVEDLKQEQADFSRMRDQEMEYPAHYTKLTFRIEPDMDRNQFRVVDCAQSDQPRYKPGVKRPEYASAISLGVIGGAYTPVLMHVGQGDQQVYTAHIAMSALHFEPAKEIEWRIVFQEKPYEDKTFSLK